MRASRLGLLSAGLGLAVVAGVTSADSLAPGLAVADASVGLTLVACGVVASEQRAKSRTGSLMTLAGFAWLAGSLLPAAIFWHRGPLVHLCVTYPTGRLRRRLALIAVGVAYVDGLVKPIASNDVVTLAVAAWSLSLPSISSFGRPARPGDRAPSRWRQRSHTPARWRRARSCDSSIWTPTRPS